MKISWISRRIMRKGIERTKGDSAIGRTKVRRSVRFGKNSVENDKDFQDLSIYGRGKEEFFKDDRRCNVARDYQRITILPPLPPAKQNFPSLSLSSIPSLFLPLFLRFSQFFLATFTPRFARLWHRVRWIFLDSQRESTATTIRLVTRPVPSFLTPARVHAGKYAGRPCTLIHSRPFYRPMGSIGIWSEYTQMAFFLSFYFFIFFSFFLSYGALMKSWKEGGDF